MDERPKEPWYFKTSSLIIVFLCIGPLALPLVWFNPRFSQKVKIIISVIVIALSYYLGLLVINSLKSISKYYQAILQ
jgi:hypothetical protein